MPLILSRREGESIRIGDSIIVTVQEVKPRSNRIKLAIEAPPEVPVHRSEVYDSIKREKGGCNAREDNQKYRQQTEG